MESIFALVFMDEEPGIQERHKFSGSLLAIYVTNLYLSDFIDSRQRRLRKVG